jgi:hypothetical protein
MKNSFVLEYRTVLRFSSLHRDRENDLDLSMKQG